MDLKEEKGQWIRVLFYTGTDQWIEAEKENSWIEPRETERRIGDNKILQYETSEKSVIKQLRWFVSDLL